MSKYSSYILYMLITILVVIVYINSFGPMEGLQHSINDFLARVTASTPAQQNVVRITVDGKSQEKFGSWPWNYDRVADLLAATASGEPKAIVLDFMLNEDTHQDSAGFTDVLAGQLSWISNVVIPYDVALATFRTNRTNNSKYLFDYSVAVNNPLGIMKEESSLQVRKVFLPAEKLLADKPYLGYDFLMPDDDRVLRHQSLVMNFDGYYYPSSSLLGAAVYLGVPPGQITVIEGDRIQLGNKFSIPISDKSELFIKYSKEHAFPTYSAQEVLTEEFNHKKFKDKLVVIDVDDPETNQAFITPVSTQLSKAEIQANVLENIVNNDVVTIKDNQLGLNLLLLFLIGGLCAFLMPQTTLGYRIIILLGALVVLANINYFMFSSFHIVADTVYFALELTLFIFAAPLLDTQLIAGQQPTTKHKNASPRSDLRSINQAAKIAELEVKVREIKATDSDPDYQPTRAISGDADQQFPEDHQAISLDSSYRADATGMTEESDDLQPPEGFDSGRNTIGPEIISPDSEDSSDDNILASSGINLNDSGQLSDSDEIVASSGKNGTSLKNLGRYQITGSLGKGAMGHVYKGIDPAINRPVALKTIRLDFVNDPDEMAELKERLFREAQAAGKLSHPNIVTIYDVGSEGHLQYIAMEYLEGQTLEDMIKRKVKFNYRIISQMIVQICSALEYAHEQGIVHRDIKPANIMVLKDYRVKLMDYGIARIDSNSMTKTGIAMGTPNYISPEQLKGLKVDKRADIFSLGVVMYEMLLGRRPFKGENITSLIYSILNQEPEKPSNINPQVPLLFDHIVDKALRKNPNERYQNARELMSDLADFVESFSTK